MAAAVGAWPPGAAATDVPLPGALTGSSSEAAVGRVAALVGAGGLLVAAPSSAPASLPLHPASAAAANRVTTKRERFG
jgi:hypothetical protein